MWQKFKGNFRKILQNSRNMFDKMMGQSIFRPISFVLYSINADVELRRSSLVGLPFAFVQYTQLEILFGLASIQPNLYEIDKYRC